MPRTLGMFPLSTVLYPHGDLPLHVFEDRYRTLMADCLDAEGEFGVVLISRGSEVGGGDQRVGIGTVARIVDVAPLDDGRLMVLARGAARVRVKQWLHEDPYPRAEVEDLPLPVGTDPEGARAEAELSVRRLRSLLSELGAVPALPHDLGLAPDREVAAWQLATLAPLGPSDRQRVLASPTLTAQLCLLAELSGAMAGDVVALLSEGLE